MCLCILNCDTKSKNKNNKNKKQSSLLNSLPTGTSKTKKRSPFIDLLSTSTSNKWQVTEQLAAEVDAAAELKEMKTVHMIKKKLHGDRGQDQDIPVKADHALKTSLCFARRSNNPKIGIAHSMWYLTSRRHLLYLTSCIMLPKENSTSLWYPPQAGQHQPVSLRVIHNKFTESFKVETKVNKGYHNYSVTNLVILLYGSDR